MFLTLVPQGREAGGGDEGGWGETERDEAKEKETRGGEEGSRHRASYEQRVKRRLRET